MAKTLSENLRVRVIAAVEGGLSRHAAAERFGIGGGDRGALAARVARGGGDCCQAARR